MDFQRIVDSFYAPTCIVSVEPKPDSGYGAIRLVACNGKYADMIDMRVDTGFVPGSPYTDYFPENRSFEDVCYRAAVQKKESHTYAHLEKAGIWFDIYAMPVDCEDGGLRYCTYMATPSSNADAILDTVNATQTSNDVLKTCVKLHKANNLKEAMESVISDIRKICKAEGCTVLLIDHEEEDYSILATDFVENSTIRRVTSFNNYYNIAASWEAMLGDERDCIIVRNKEDMEYVSKINNPWYQTLVEAGVKSVVLFPLRQGNELLGFIWAVNFDTENALRIKETLELTTFFASSHIARYKVIQRLEHMSYTDPLTGLPNGFACTECMNKLIDSGGRFAGVSIDINNFKSINTSLGFEAGNMVLNEVKRRWKAIADRPDKTTADDLMRIGADEFFIVISGYQDEEQLRSEIGLYVEALGESLNIYGVDLYVTASFGYAEYPADADSADMLMSHANAAMAEIQSINSSEHILRFDPAILKDEHLLEIENMIRTALENDSIFFNLQPQYDLGHKLRGFEALARMKDSEGNVISPVEFIPVAEKVGLIDRVDGTVFRKASAFFGKLIKETGADLTLSINASARHLMKSDFLDEIKTLLEQNSIPADKLEIEITESIMIESFGKAINSINELKKMGIQIAIDDFGTGYSSLSYLHRFPADLLKIDKSFIDKMNANDSSREYVAAIISIGHVMGFDVISEGVETTEQLETLKAAGCDFIQGFIWGKPLSAEDAEQLVIDAQAEPRVK